MDIQQLAKKPELIQISLDNEEIVKNYGEPVTFWMKDQLDLNTYFDFFKSQGQKDGDKLNEIISRIILNAEGQPVLKEGDQLPIDITVELLVKVNECLGKSRTKSSTLMTGTPQE